MRVLVLGMQLVFCFVTILAYVGLFLLMSSFCGSNWVRYQVARELLTVGSDQAYQSHPELFHSRTRGLFETCFDEPVDNLAWLSNGKFAVVLTEEGCLTEQGYELESGDAEENFERYGYHYKLRTYLMRLHWISFAISSLFLMFCSLSSTFSIWTEWSFCVQTTGSLFLCSAGLIFVGLTSFLVYSHLENYYITAEVEILPFYAFTRVHPLYKSLMQTPSVGIYGSSFLYGCFSFVVCVGTGFMDLIIATVFTSQDISDVEPTKEVTPLLDSNGNINKISNGKDILNGMKTNKKLENNEQWSRKKKNKNNNSSQSVFQSTVRQRIVGPYVGIYEYSGYDT